MEFNNQQKSLLYTILYSDIFDFPLTEEELWLDLIADKKMDKATMIKTASSLQKIISHKKGFFCLTGKEKIIKNRINRAKIAQKKLKIAASITKYLSYIPTILFIGVSGRLSHLDADNNDDIDIFIITKNNTIWATRLLLLFVLELMSVRRKRDDLDPKNKICPNLIIEESALAWPSDKRDLYTAHEIAHIHPLFNRNNTYQRFLEKNKWINSFYPNRGINHYKESIPDKSRNYIIIKTISFLITLPLFEYILSQLQKIYMKNKRTNEVILSNFLAFHPRDYRKEILSNFASKIKTYGVAVQDLTKP